MTTPGDVCRKALIDVWIASNPNSTFIESLVALQGTQLFAEIKSGCQSHVDAFNVASGETCLLQNSSPGITYSDFWQIGPANMDADWSIATDLAFSGNFTEAPFIIPCANSCYSNFDGIPGCEIGKTFLNESNFGKVPQERVCALKWSELDQAYNALRLCGAKTVGNPTNGTLEEMLAELELQADTQAECSTEACSNGQTPPSSSASSLRAKAIRYFFWPVAAAILLGIPSSQNEWV